MSLCLVAPSFACTGLVPDLGASCAKVRPPVAWPPRALHCTVWCRASCCARAGASVMCVACVVWRSCACSGVVCAGGGAFCARMQGYVGSRMHLCKPSPSLVRRHSTPLSHLLLVCACVCCLPCLCGAGCGFAQCRQWNSAAGDLLSTSPSHTIPAQGFVVRPTYLSEVHCRHRHG